MGVLLCERIYYFMINWNLMLTKKSFKPEDVINNDIRSGMFR